MQFLVHACHHRLGFYEADGFQRAQSHVHDKVDAAQKGDEATLTVCPIAEFQSFQVLLF